MKSCAALKDAKLALEDRVNELEQQLTFLTSERDDLIHIKAGLSKAAELDKAEVDEMEVRISEEKQRHQSEVDALKAQLREAKERTDATEEVCAVCAVITTLQDCSISKLNTES